MDNVLQLVIAIFSSTVISGFLTYLATRRKTNMDELVLIISEYKAERLALKQEVERNDLLIGELQKQVYILQSQIVFFESATYDHVNAHWLTSIDGVMLYVNKEYERTFLNDYNLSAKDCIGKKISDLYNDQKFAERYMENNKWVVENKMSWIGVEKFVNPEGETTLLVVQKYPRFRNNEVIGVAGMCLDLDVIKNVIKQY